VLIGIFYFLGISRKIGINFTTLLIDIVDDVLLLES